MEKAKIEANIANMQSQAELPDIYFDMDNTLALFSIHGQESIALQGMWSEGYFIGLPVFPEAPAVLQTLIHMGYRVGIVSNCMDTPFCKTEKSLYIKHHFPMIADENVYLLEENGKREQVLPRAHQSILVDDYGVNLHAWYENGGVGIKKSYSGKPRAMPVITSLTDIFTVLWKFNLLPKL